MSTTTILKPSVIQPNERILITGANGFIGSHVTSLFLSLGYLVRGTIRVEKPWLDQFFESKYGPGKYESVIVPELNSKDDLARVMTGVSGVVHVVCVDYYLPTHYYVCSTGLNQSKNFCAHAHRPRTHHSVRMRQR